MLSPPQPHHHAAATKDDIWDIREVPASSVRRLPEAGDEMGKTLEVFRDGKNILFPWIWLSSQIAMVLKSMGIRNNSMNVGIIFWGGCVTLD